MSERLVCIPSMIRILFPFYSLGPSTLGPSSRLDLKAMILELPLKKCDYDWVSQAISQDLLSLPLNYFIEYISIDLITNSHSFVASNHLVTDLLTSQMSHEIPKK